MCLEGSDRTEMARIEKRSTISRCTALALLLTTLCCCVGAAPAPTGDTRAMMYLAQYGYLSPSVRNPSSSMIIDEPTWTKAITEFQSFAGLNATGELDDETAKLMTLPRCGVKDKVGFGESRSKRYALQGSRWRVKNLTYKIAKYPRLLNRQEVDVELAKAFAVWSDYTDLTFTQKRSGQVHIEIRFEKGEHGDGDPFDGPGGTLAHAYFPVYGGDAHFDDAEKWSINSMRGTNLFQVAAHEFGHSLGLSHSDVRSALMAPFYRGYDPSFQLDIDDVQGIQALYGRKTQVDVGGGNSLGGTVPRITTPEPAAAEDTALCADPRFDTIFNSADGSTFIFKGEHYWKLTEDGVASGYPRLISRAWPGLPGNIDAAFTYKNGKSYFFKGSKYWRYNGQRMDGDYPKDISEGFTGIPDNIDAALVWSGNGKIYFYKGSKFWRFDPAQRPPVKSTYPKPLSNWEGVPDSIDAALQYTNGYTYFYKDGAYYRFNDRTFSVDQADPAFPRSTAYWWLGCKSAPRGTVGGSAQLIAPTKSAEVVEHDDVGDIVFDAGWFRMPPEAAPVESARLGENITVFGLSRNSIVGRKSDNGSRESHNGASNSDDLVRGSDDVVARNFSEIVWVSDGTRNLNKDVRDYVDIRDQNIVDGNFDDFARNTQGTSWNFNGVPHRPNFVRNSDHIIRNPIDLSRNFDSVIRGPVQNSDHLIQNPEVIRRSTYGVTRFPETGPNSGDVVRISDEIVRNSTNVVRSYDTVLQSPEFVREASRAKHFATLRRAALEHFRKFWIRELNNIEKKEGKV